MRLTAAALAVMMTAGFCIAAGSAVEAAQAKASPIYAKAANPKKPRTVAQKKAQAKATKAAATKVKQRGPSVKQKQAQKKATKAAAAKAKAKPNKVRR